MKTNNIILIFCFLLLFSCKEESKSSLVNLKGKVFGTSYHIIYESDKNFQGAIDSLFSLTNKSLSTYMKDSDISRINANDTTVVVDDMFLEVFNKAKRIYKETDGYFDPTLAIVIDAYGFGSGKRKARITASEIKKLMNYVDFDNVYIASRKVHKPNLKVQLNVNAFAKGYGIDVIGRFLETKGVRNYLVEIGGELRVRGLKNGKPWKVAVEKPNTDGTQSFHKIIELTDKSMATSGNYRKFRVDSVGNKYVHIINPKTGLAQESDLLSASVIADGDCADVDAYATAFMAMGFEKTKVFLEKHPNIKVILLYLDDKGEIKELIN